MACSSMKTIAIDTIARAAISVPSMQDASSTASVKLTLPTTHLSPSSPMQLAPRTDRSQHCTTPASFASKLPSRDPLPANDNKSALSFILSPQSAQLSQHEDLARCETSRDVLLRYKDFSTCAAAYTPSWLSADWLTPTKGAATTVVASRASLVNNTGGYTFTKATGLCVVDGCTKLSKYNKRCWRHGGSIKCKIAGCDNRAKSKGVCWSHGGGTLCRVEGCDTIAVSRGVCWAHGGGKRCQLPDCSRPAYERTRNYCVLHCKVLTAGQRQVRDQ